jgi:hypothetical protein
MLLIFYCFIACFDLCINVDPKIDPKKKIEQMGGSISIEIYIGFVYVIGFYYFASNSKPICFKSEFDCHSARNTVYCVGKFLK